MRLFCLPSGFPAEQTKSPADVENPHFTDGGGCSVPRQPSGFARGVLPMPRGRPSAGRSRASRREQERGSRQGSARACTVTGCGQPGAPAPTAP